MIRVTIADDHPLMREGIKKVLNDEIDMNVVSEAGVEDDIMRILKETPSEVLILDITMKGRSWTHLVRDISSSYPYLGVLIFSTIRKKSMQSEFSKRVPKDMYANPARRKCWLLPLGK